ASFDGGGGTDAFLLEE
ncbi:hypothetical protein A2U01_0096197, partial [Trifolium medium]|nr:hypothetical protein [Trifolium medium]